MTPCTLDWQRKITSQNCKSKIQGVAKSIHIIYIALVTDMTFVQFQPQILAEAPFWMRHLIQSDSSDSTSHSSSNVKLVRRFFFILSPLIWRSAITKNICECCEEDSSCGSSDINIRSKRNRILTHKKSHIFIHTSEYSAIKYIKKTRRKKKRAHERYTLPKSPIVMENLVSRYNF